MIILNIDTATENASICISKEGVPIGTKVNGEQKDHAAWIQVAISELLKETALTMQELQAIAKRKKLFPDLIAGKCRIYASPQRYKMTLYYISP